MEGMNACIVKKQIYYEFNNFFNVDDRINRMNDELFIQYIDNLIKFYKTARTNIYLTSIELLEEINKNYHDNFQIMTSKCTIEKINNVDVLLNILSFFIGKTNSRKFIYYV